ncbi:unnamed protein product, partial [Staurois parvus]
SNLQYLAIYLVYCIYLQYQFIILIFSIYLKYLPTIPILSNQAFLNQGAWALWGVPWQNV